MPDLAELAEDVTERTKDLLRPNPWPRRLGKIGLFAGLIILLLFIARLMWEIYQVPVHREDTE